MPKPVCAKPSAAEKAEKLHDTFTKFVGQTFYGQMIKSMRSTVGQAAYFNGGQAEKMFQGQLDQTLAEQMTKATAERFAEPLFQRQFPQRSGAGKRASTGNQAAGLNDLSRAVDGVSTALKSTRVLSRSIPLISHIPWSTSRILGKATSPCCWAICPTCREICSTCWQRSGACWPPATSSDRRDCRSRGRINSPAASLPRPSAGTAGASGRRRYCHPIAFARWRQNSRRLGAIGSSLT